MTFTINVERHTILLLIYICVSMYACCEKTVKGRSDNECNQKVTELKKWLVALEADEKNSICNSSKVFCNDLAKIDELRIKYEGISNIVDVGISRNSITVEGNTILKYDSNYRMNEDGNDQWNNNLVSFLNKCSEIHKEELAGNQGPEMRLAIDKNALWLYVATFIREAEKVGYRNYSFLFLSNVGGPMKISNSEYTDDLGEIRSHNSLEGRYVASVPLLKKAFINCPSVYKEINGILKASLAGCSKERMQTLRHGKESMGVLADVVKKCKCKVDIEYLKSVLWELIQPNPVILLDFKIGNKDDNQIVTIEAEGSKKWHEVCQYMIEHITKHRNSQIYLVAK